MFYRPAADTKARPGSADWFAGRVWAEALADADAAPAHVVRVWFEPGARTAWHVHEHGQVLVVTSGRGSVQKRGEARQPIAAGDVVVIAPGEDHWHGADPDCPMQHLAVHRGGDVAWGDQVSEGEYRGA